MRQRGKIHMLVGAGETERKKQTDSEDKDCGCGAMAGTLISTFTDIGYSRVPYFACLFICLQEVTV